MGEFIRERVPDWLTYTSAAGIVVNGRGKWRSILCVFHDDTHPSLRINTESGGWCCMSCGASGGDTLDYHMRSHNLEFTAGAKALGAWAENGTSTSAPLRPRTLSARDGLELLYHDSMLLFVIGSDIASRKALSDPDLASVFAATRRILIVYEGVVR